MESKLATVSEPARPATVDAVSRVLAGALMLQPDVAAGLSAETRLFGHLPELDSMAVATVLTALEDAFHIHIDDEDVSAEMFETLGGLASYIDARLGTR
ncbi:acyl carrier protein [Thermaurantiacus sp.]